MRNLRNPQLERGEVRIEDIELDLKSRDDTLMLLIGLQYLYSQEALRDRIFREHRFRQPRQCLLVSGVLILCAQKPISASKRGGDHKIAALCRLPNRRPISEAVPNGKPPALLVKAL